MSEKHDGQPDQAPAPSLTTRLVHSEYTPPSGFESLTTPVHHVSTVVYPNVAETRTRYGPDAYTYGLHATPTSLVLMRQVAELEGGYRTVLTPSGLASIALVDFAFLHAGDHVLIPSNAYRPNRELAHRLLSGLNITTTYYDPLVGDGIEELVQPNTRLLWIEAPGSLTMEVPDVAALVACAKRHRIVTAIDNTWSAGVYFRAFEKGIDVSVQALTKYVGGHSDMLMGSVTAATEELFDRIAPIKRLLGFGVAPDDIYLALRGLPTMLSRLKVHEASALQIATWLRGRPEVKRVLHPAFPECPGHEFWKRDFTGSSGLFSFIVHERYDVESVDALIDGLRWFKIGYSWGGVASLAISYRYDVLQGPAGRAEQGHLVRLNIGLEDPADLIADLDQGLGRLRPAK